MEKNREVAKTGIAEQKFCRETQWTGKIVLTFFSPVKFDFRCKILRRFLEKMSVLQREFFIMSVVSPKKMAVVHGEKKIWGINFKSSVLHQTMLMIHWEMLILLFSHPGVLGPNLVSRWRAALI